MTQTAKMNAKIKYKNHKKPKKPKKPKIHKILSTLYFVA